MGFRSIYLFAVIFLYAYGCHHQMLNSQPIPQEEPEATVAVFSDASKPTSNVDTNPPEGDLTERMSAPPAESVQQESDDLPDIASPTAASGRHTRSIENYPTEADLPLDPVLRHHVETTTPAESPDHAEPGKSSTIPVEESAAKEKPPHKSAQMIMDESLDFCQAAQEFWQKGELENALEALDQAYSLILEIEVTEQPEILQQKEVLRFLISKRILEIYASRNIVVNGNYNAIPMEMNKYVEAELKLFTQGAEKKFFKQSYIRSGKYRPLIVSKLKEAGIPEELSWLPLIESGFKVKALSRARALGLWQFIPSTGYKFGLKRSQYIDERIDPEKSTDAAIAYLKELHSIFGDWTTVLAAYNCGEGRVLRVIRSQNVNYLDNFWDLYERLPFETARYVPRFLATLHIISNSEKYGLDAVTPESPLEYEIVEVNRQAQLTDIASKINVPSQELKDMNPELRYNILPPERYALKVPPEKADLLLAAIDTIPISYPPRPAYVVHRVRKGETLSGIAHRYGTSVSRIMQANHMRKSNYIVAGKKLKIPQKGTIIARAKTPEKVTTGNTFVYHVRSGDSLWNLAKRYGTTTKKIQELNGLTSTNLYIEQKLIIPETRAEPPVSGSAQNQYLVRRGDSPYKIASRHNMPLGHFLRINGLTPRSKIYPGQLLLVE